MLFTACSLDDAWQPVLPKDPDGTNSAPAQKCVAAAAGADLAHDEEPPATKKKKKRGRVSAVQLLQGSAEVEPHRAPERLAVLLLVVVAVLIVIVTLALVAVMNQRMARMGLQLHQMQYRLLSLR